jgi:hypothetical protein
MEALFDYLAPHLAKLPAEWAVIAIVLYVLMKNRDKAAPPPDTFREDTRIALATMMQRIERLEEDVSRLFDER